MFLPYPSSISPLPCMDPTSVTQRSQQDSVLSIPWQDSDSADSTATLQPRNSNIMSSPLRPSMTHKPWTSSVSALDQEEIHDEIMSSPPRPSQTPLHDRLLQAPYTAQPQSRHITPQQQLTTQIHTTRTRRRTQFLDKLRTNRTSRRDARLNDSFEHMDWLKEKNELEARYELQAARLLKQMQDDPDVYEADAEEQQRMKEEMQARYEAETQALAEMYERELIEDEQRRRQQQQQQQEPWIPPIDPETVGPETDTPRQSRVKGASSSISDEDLMDGIDDDEFAGLLGDQQRETEILTDKRSKRADVFMT